MDFLTAIDPSGQLLLLLVTVALGAFVGLRREIELQDLGVPGFVGFRTMPLITLLGTLTTFFPLFPYMPVLGFIAILLFLGIAYYNGVFQLQLLGLTSELSTLIMFMVGVLIGYGHVTQAILITIFIAAFAAFKPQMHRFAKTISPGEWSGALQLLIITAIVLPVLPQTAIDPWGIIVPYEIWMVVIFISGIGFIGYFLNKYLGQKHGVLLTSFLGSFVSSTVVTTHIAIEAKKDTHNTNHDLYMSGIIIAIATMLARVALVLMIMTPHEYLLRVLAVPVSMIISVVIVGVYWYGKSQDERNKKGQEDKIMKHLSIKSPFELLPALQFALLFIVVLLGVQLGQVYLGSYGVVMTTFFSAFADVDAAIVSVVQALRSGVITIDVMLLVLTVALVVNTMVKVLYVWILSRKRALTKHVSTVTLVSSVVGILTYFLL